MLQPAASWGPSPRIKDEGGCNLLNFLPISSSPWGSWRMANAISGLRKVWMSPPYKSCLRQAPLEQSPWQLFYGIQE